MPTIRPAIDADIGAITTIYAHHVLNGTGTFETTPPNEEDMAGRRRDVLAKGLPYLVVEDEAEFLALPIATGSSHVRRTAFPQKTRFTWHHKHKERAWVA